MASVESEVYYLKPSIFLLFAVFVAACAAKHEKLEAYVGEDIEKAVADYGYPRAAFDMQDGHRDFQWVMRSSATQAYMISTGALTDPAKLFDPETRLENLTPEFANETVTSGCLLTIMTRWDKDKKNWIVTGYQQPTTGCEPAIR